MNNDYYKFLKELDGERKYSVGNAEKIIKAVNKELYKNENGEDNFLQEFKECLIEEEEQRNKEESWKNIKNKQKEKLDKDIDIDEWEEECAEFFNSDEYIEMVEKESQEDDAKQEMDDDGEFEREAEECSREYEEERMEIEDDADFDFDEDEEDDSQYIEDEFIIISKLFEKCMHTKYVRALKKAYDKKKSNNSKEIYMYEVILNIFNIIAAIPNSPSIESINSLIEKLEEEEWNKNANNIDFETCEKIISFLEELNEIIENINYNEAEYEYIYEDLIEEGVKFGRDFLNNLILVREKQYKENEKTKKKENTEKKKDKIKEEILKLIDKNYSYDYISKKLKVSKSTISKVKKMYEKQS